MATHDCPHCPPRSDRRNFLTKASAVVIGGVLALTAPIAGLFVFLDPLRRKSESGGAVLVASLSALPEDGEPRKFPVLATKVDAWNRSPNVPVGAVYLQRIGDKVRALNVVCPHAGCFVDFRGEEKKFHCPCHNSSFSVDGKILDPDSPSPRSLDTLQVEIRHGTEVWVKFQNFRAGTDEKIPV
jgi:menaquinol-cytochrome c reductase iron-sulfur subunit